MTRCLFAFATLLGFAAWGDAAVAQSSGAPFSRRSQPTAPPQTPSDVTPIAPQPRDAAFAACSTAYYKALEPLRTGRGAALATLPRALRAADPELPGKWQVGAPATGKQKAPPKPERVCVETKDVPGRAARCVRFETKQPVVPPDVIAKTAPTADEARVLKAIGDFVEAKGGLPDVGPNGRHFAVLSRLTLEMRNYMNQEEHPALCAGATELIDFYSAQAAPLKKRMEDVVVLARQAKDLSEQRVRAIAATEQRIYERAAADVIKVDEQRARLTEAHKVALAKAEAAAAAAPQGGAAVTLPAAPKLPDLPGLPSRPNAPAKIEDYAIVGLPSLLSEALRPLLPKDKIDAIIAAKTPVQMLVKMRATLLDREAVVTSVNAEVREAALMALRLLEARVYGDLYVARFKDLEAPLFGSLVDLGKAHSQTCTCQN